VLSIPMATATVVMLRPRLCDLCAVHLVVGRLGQACRNISRDEQLRAEGLFG
jgi:hypothetical protein